MMSNTVVITGAFSYTGRYTTRLLLERGLKVGTLTGHPPKTDVPAGVTVFPYNFDRPTESERSLAGTSTLINTYWMRFPRRKATFEAAVHHSCGLIQAARDAGVRRIAHVSIANPSRNSPLGSYKGKALVEQAVRESGLSYCILRPTVIFGKEDMLATISHGSFESCPSLAFLATANTGFAQSTWRTWPNCWPMPWMAKAIE
jgi:uncharacterized protein YbjT (DUF2867 family)